MSALLIIGIMVVVAGIGAYQIYLDTQDKKNNCPCGGNCRCNE